MLLLLIPAGLQAASRPSIISGARNSGQAIGVESRLWEELYRDSRVELESHDAEAANDHVTQDENESSDAQLAQSQLMALHSKHVTAPLATDVLYNDQTESDDEESLAPVAISEWQIAKLGTLYGNDYTPRSSDGPTATTLLVGLVAAIVLIGAVFSGKE